MRKPYLLWGSREYLTAQLRAWEGLGELVGAFGGCSEAGASFLGKPVLSPEEIGEDPAWILCMGPGLPEQDAACLKAAGIGNERMADLSELLGIWQEEQAVRPAKWRVLRENPRPKKIRLELCSLCQLNCVTCYMRRGADRVYGNGYLKSGTFRRILDQNPFIEEIEISNNGEVFLNPELEQILEYAYQKGVKLTAEGGVNFNDVRDSSIEAMVRYPLQDLVVAADGATNEAYSRYRRKGDIHKVFRNIRRLQEAKERYGSPYPRIHWQYIIMESSEPDIEEAKRIAGELGIDIHFKLTWDKDYRPVDPERIKRATGLSYVTREEFERGTGEPYGPGHPICRELFDAPRVNWDGRLFGCCAQHSGDLGVNILDTGLEAALNSPQIAYSRKMLCGQAPEAGNADEIPCLKCHTWHQMQKNHWRFCLEDER